MTMEINPVIATEVELDLSLAGLETKCTECPACVDRPTVTVTCINGKMPRFKTLRTHCPDENCWMGKLLEDDLPFQRAGQAHKWCGGRGWVPAVTIASLLATIPAVDTVEFRPQPLQGSTLCLIGHYVPLSWAGVVGVGATHYEALLRARVALVRAEAPRCLSQS